VELKVKKIELFHVSIPLPKNFYPSWIPGYPQGFNRFTLIRLTTDDGFQGYSAGIAMEEEREGLGSLVGPYLIDQVVENIDDVNQRLREASFLGWRNNWIEAAFWDLLGKKEGKPLYRLLGGEGGRLPTYCSTGEVREPGKRADEVLALKDMGFNSVKLRVHDFDLEDDIAQIKEVRRAVGDDMEIGVDANQGWRVAAIKDAPLWDLERATEFAKACEEYNISWLEEPLDMYAFDDMAELRRRTTTPISGGELTPGLHEHMIMLEKGSLDIYQPDACFCGVSTSLRIMQEVNKQGLKFKPHTWTNGIGFAINLHIAAANPQRLPLEFPYEPPAWTPRYRDGILVRPFMVDKEGCVSIPEKPGLGIDINPRALKKFGRKFYEMTPAKLAVSTVRNRGIRNALELAKAKKGDSSLLDKIESMAPENSEK